MTAAPDRSRWTWPKYSAGDQVVAKLHNGAIREGRITHVETHYARAENFWPYHIYSFRWPQSRRAQHLGESQILERRCGAADQ